MLAAPVSVEQRILQTLSKKGKRMDLDGLIASVREADDDVRAIDVKLAALDLVSQGKLLLDEVWQLHKPLRP
jgi:hypothetical protein